MPIFIYRCPECKKETEEIVKNDKEIVSCECGCTMKKSQTPNISSFRLSGSGWEKDGYSKK